MPVATSVPMTEPAEVPTMYSASAARQPVSDSSASSAPISHDAPTTPPAPRTMPTRMPWDSDLRKTPANLGRRALPHGGAVAGWPQNTRWFARQTFTGTFGAPGTSAYRPVRAEGLE